MVSVMVSRQQHDIDELNDSVEKLRRVYTQPLIVVPVKREVTPGSRTHRLVEVKRTLDLRTRVISR